MKKRNSTSDIPVANPNITEKVKSTDSPVDKTKVDDFTDYEDLTNPESVDIYSEENNYDIDIITEKEETQNDLDIPGSELDDDQEDIGSEDEENNYYSIGGDNHNELEEDKID